MTTTLNYKKTLISFAVVTAIASLTFAYFVYAEEPTTPSLSVFPASLSFSGTVGGTDSLAQTLTVSNIGTGTMSWTASDDASWLAVTPVSGESNGTAVTVSVSLTGLVAGTYNATVTVGATGASNSPKTIPVSLVLTAPAPTPTPPPGRMKSSIEINPNGKTQLRNAKVLSISASSLSVKLWGLTFGVDTKEATKFHAKGGKIELTDIKTDHYVDVKGAINEESGVIMAREIKDNSITTSAGEEFREGKIAELMKKIEELKKMLKELRGKKGNNHDDD